jgi:hypothetical protein
MNLKETEHVGVKQIELVKSRALHLCNKTFMSHRKKGFPLTPYINYNMLVKNSVAWG